MSNQFHPASPFQLDDGCSLMRDVDEDSEAESGLSGKKFHAWSVRSVVGTDWEQMVSKFLEILPVKKCDSLLLHSSFVLYEFLSGKANQERSHLPPQNIKLMYRNSRLAVWPWICRGMRPHKDPYVVILMAPFYRPK